MQQKAKIKNIKYPTTLDLRILHNRGYHHVKTIIVSSKARSFVHAVQLDKPFNVIKLIVKSI